MNIFYFRVEKSNLFCCSLRNIWSRLSGRYDDLDVNVDDNEENQIESDSETSPSTAGAISSGGSRIIGVGIVVHNNNNNNNGVVPITDDMNMDDKLNESCWDVIDETRCQSLRYPADR